MDSHFIGMFRFLRYDRRKEEGEAIESFACH